MLKNEKIYAHVAVEDITGTLNSNSNIETKTTPVSIEESSKRKSCGNFHLHNQLQG